MLGNLRKRMRESRETRHVVIAFFILVGVLVVGTVGYILIEDMNFTHALYMTVITISTVGFREVQPLGTGGIYFTIVLIVLGVSAVLFFMVGIIEFILSKYIGDVWGRRRMNNVISRLKNHYIICGYGRVGRSVAEELASQSKEFVVIEKDPVVFDRCVRDGFLAIDGSATDPLVLVSAGIERAVGLVSALKSDADNLYVILTARQMRPDILLIARADQPGSEEKLDFVGADRVISPHKIAGRRMANLMLRPRACEFLDVVNAGNIPEYQLNEVSITEGSSLKGQTIKDVGLRQHTGVTVLSVREKGETAFNVNPDPETTIETGDVLIIIGTPDQMARMEALL